MLECLNFKKIKQDAYRKTTEKKNKHHKNAFASTAFGDRVIFVPQCMRNIERCKAKEMGGYYICAECGFCKVGPVSKKSKDLGYKALYILKGGRIADKLIKESGAKAVLGVACFYEGSEGMRLCEKNNIIVQFAPLTKDGCVATDVNLDEVLEKLIIKN